MIDVDLDSATSVFGRVATLGGAYRVALAPLIDRLSALAPELAETAVVTVPSSFDRVAVGTTLTRGDDGIERARVLCRTCDPGQPARFEQLVGAQTEEIAVELESIPADEQAFACTVTAYGRRRLGADLDRLAGFGVAPDVLARLDELTTELVGPDKLIGLADRAESTGARAWTLHVAHRNTDASQRAASIQRIIAVAAKVGVTAPQRNMIGGLHAAFAGSRDNYSWLRTRDHDPSVQLGVLWADVGWEDIVNILLTFHPRSEAAAGLGALSGAFGARAAAALELELGLTEPPRTRIAVALTKGSP